MSIEKALDGGGNDVVIGVDPDEEVVEIDFGEEGVVIDFDPNPEVEVEHDDNLAEFIEETELARIGSELVRLFDADKRSRSDWEMSYQKGLDLLGLKIESRSEPWEGACGVVHPLLTESIVRFQSHAILETFPAGGPVKTRIVGDSKGEDVEKQAMRIREDMNYLVTEEIEDYRSEHERMLFNLPLCGSAFKKCWYDPVRQTPVSMFVPADDLVVAYGATSLNACTRFTHMLRMHDNELHALQVAGFYSGVEVSQPEPEWSDADRAEDDETGVHPTIETDDRHLILEMHIDWDFPDTPFADPEGIAKPYVISVMRDGTILSIRRNWKEDDPKYKKKKWFAHYCYLPGLGFYGIGLIHLIGGITDSATSILRQLVDAGTLANLPGGFKLNTFKAKDHDKPIEPGEFRDVDVPGDRIRDAIMPLPYGEPSVVLFQLLQSMAEEGRRLGSIAEMDVNAAGKEMPVGTVLAIMERSLKVMSAVQARLHAALRDEFRILSRIIFENMPPEYPFAVDGGHNRQTDYDGRVDVLPVSDPNATTQAQKVIQYQAASQMAQMAPELYNRPKLHRDMMVALQIKDAEEIVPMEGDMKPMDPVAENMSLLRGEPVKAFLHQDHESHIAVHMAAMKDPKIAEMVGQSPMGQAIQKAAIAHVTEHVAYQYRVEVEKKLGAPLPPEGESLPPEVEAQLSPLIAQAASKLLQKDVQEAEAKRIVEQQKDPVVQMQLEEVAIKKRQQEEQARKNREEERLREKEIDAQERIAGARIGAQVGQAKMKGGQQARKDGMDSAIRMAEAVDRIEDRKNRDKAENKPKGGNE